MKSKKEIPVFDPTKLDEYEQITPQALSIMDMFKDNVFIIDKYWDIKTYDNFIMTLLGNMSHGYEHEEFRKCPTQFKFHDDDDVMVLPYNHFIVNVIMWRPQICLEPEALGENHIISSAKMSKFGPVLIKNYMDDFYVTKYNRHIPTKPNLSREEINPELNYIFAETNYLLSRISARFSKFFGISSSIEVFMNLAKRNPEFDKLIHFKLNEQQQPIEIEQERDKLIRDLVDNIMNDQQFNLLKPLLQPKSGLNVKQFGELIGNICMKPDEEGNTIPYVINTNYLTGELKNIKEYYLIAILGRKAQILNNEFMGKTGHLLNQVAILCMSTKLSKTVDDCRTVNPVPFVIKSDEHLKRLEGRRYRFPGTRTYNTIQYKRHKNLVGETIYVRSPITCSAPDGVCRECYGELFYTNIDNYATGVFSATTIMNPVAQGILSAKHFQSTNSTRIEFQPEFYNFFEIYATDIIIKPNIEDIFDYSLVIRVENIVTDSDDDDGTFTKKTKTRGRRKKTESETSDAEGFVLSDDISNSEDELDMGVTPYSTTKFEIVKYRKVKGVEPIRYEFYDKELKDLYIHKDLVDKMIYDKDEYGDYIYIPLDDINPDEFVFLMDVANNELTKPMKMIQKALNNKDHAGCSDYEALANKMLDLIIQSKMDAMSVHSEVIVRELVRSSYNVLKRPDFSRLCMTQDYQLMTISSALKKNPAVNTSLSTAYLKDQLIGMAETYEKWEQSEFDNYFKLRLNEDF